MVLHSDVRDDFLEKVQAVWKKDFHIGAIQGRHVDLVGRVGLAPLEGLRVFRLGLDPWEDDIQRGVGDGDFHGQSISKSLFHTTYRL